MFKVSYNIEESIIVNAPLKTVWDNVLYFKNSQKWSPWLILDKNCKSTISGEDGTLEAKYSWDGELVGSGEQFNTEIIENKEIKSKVVFLKPFKNIGENYFRFEELDGKIKVIWGMKSYLPFFIFFLKNMISKMISKDFQRGLKMLKILCESGELNTTTTIKKDIKIDEFYWLGVNGNANMENIGTKIVEDFKKLENFGKQNNIIPLNVLSFYTPNCNMEKGYFEYIVAYKVNKEDFDKIESNKEIKKGIYNETNSLKVIHTGSYDFIDNSWTCGMMALRSFKLKQNKGLYAFELYLNDPKEVEEKSLITEIYIPIK